jgi:hypothetical protein
MYCSSCGVAVAPGLSYCNYCGERLGVAQSDVPIRSREVRPESLIAAMVFTFVFGLVAITVLMGMMKGGLHLENGLILFVALLSFLVMLSLEAVFIRLLFRRRRGAEEAGDPVLRKGPTTRELDAAHARGLPGHMPSVTEHTTRAFDPVYPERTPKS